MSQSYILSQPKSVRSQLFQEKTLFVRLFVRANVFFGPAEFFDFFSPAEMAEMAEMGFAQPCGMIIYRH